MKVYEPNSVDEVKLERLWETMMKSGDMAANFPPACLSLYSFMTMMQSPTSLVFEEDDQGIWFAMWLEPTTWNFGVVSLWIREDHRQARAAYQAIILALHHFFTKVDAVMAYTHSDKQYQENVKFGFSGLGVLPGQLYIMRLTAEEFVASQRLTAVA